MEYVIAFLLAWTILAIPVFFLAYARFLIKENKATRYAAVYGRATLMILLFLAVLGAYIFIPYFLGRLSASPEYAVEGSWYDKTTGDTLNFSNGTLTIDGSIPENDMKGFYTLSSSSQGFQQQYEAGLSAIISQPVLSSGNKRMLTMSYTDSSAYKKAVASKLSKKKLNNYSNRPQYRSLQWWVETKSEKELNLTPVNSEYSYFKTRVLVKL